MSNSIKPSSWHTEWAGLSPGCSTTGRWLQVSPQLCASSALQTSGERWQQKSVSIPPSANRNSTCLPLERILVLLHKICFANAACSSPAGCAPQTCWPASALQLRLCRASAWIWCFSERGTWGHGLVVDLAVLGLRLDSMILKVFSNLNDSMILYAQAVLYKHL